MGARGPLPLPANVHRLRGNASKLPAGRLLDELQPDVEIPGCPKILWPEARKEWRRLATELERYGLVSKLDRGALAVCCQEWARIVWCETKIAELNAADPAGEAGMVEKAQSGYRMSSVYLNILRKSQAVYDRYLQHFGLSPAARSRVTPSSAQPQLPGMPPKEGFGAF